MLCGLWGERTTEKVKLLRQFLVIMAVSFVGEILHAVLPLPIPASIYGLVLMLALLMTGALKLDTVEDAGKFMIEIMPVMFIPAGVGLMESWGQNLLHHIQDNQEHRRPPLPQHHPFPSLHKGRLPHRPRH